MDASNFSSVHTWFSSSHSLATGPEVAAPPLFTSFGALNQVRPGAFASITLTSSVWPSSTTPFFVHLASDSELPTFPPPPPPLVPPSTTLSLGMLASPQAPASPVPQLSKKTPISATVLSSNPQESLQSGEKMAYHFIDPTPFMPPGCARVHVEGRKPMTRAIIGGLRGRK